MWMLPIQWGHCGCSASGRGCVIGKHEVQKATTDSSRRSAAWTRNIGADGKCFSPHDRQVVFKRCLTKLVIITAVTDSDLHVENLAAGIWSQFFHKAPRWLTTWHLDRDVIPDLLAKWRLIGCCSPHIFKRYCCKSNRVRQCWTLFNKALCVKQTEVSLRVWEHLWGQCSALRASSRLCSSKLKRNHDKSVGYWLTQDH